MDITQTVLVNLELKAENFVESGFYKCDYTEDKPLVLGVNIFYLFKLLKTLNNDDILSFYVDDTNPGILDIRLENNAKSSVTKYALNLIEIDEENLSMPDCEFDVVITYNAASFQKIIKDMSNLSQTIEIKSYNKQLIFSCQGDYASQETTIGEATDDIKFNKSTDEIIQGCYLSKHLLSFTKCTNLCNNVTLYLKNDYPLFIKYTAGCLGKITLVVASKTD
jgi:proliferating cell nuclear antigen PCNA